MRNVVMVTFDSHRLDHCSFAGAERETTPTLDRMAADGVRFDHAVAPGPSTPESMPVIMTGEHPVRATDGGGSLLAERQAVIRRHMEARETLAEQFSRAGYDTAGFTPNPYTSRYFGFDAGFDDYEDFMTGSREELYERMLDGFLDGTSLGAVLPIRILLNWVQREEVFKPWEAFYDDVLSWTRAAEEPYFVWILLMDTHDPYLVPSEYRTQSRWAMYHANYRLWRQGHEPPFSDRTHDRLVRAYDDTIEYADAFLERLRSDLSDDDPIIAVHGDHGEAFGEHGTYGHHQQLYEENVHVPFVIDGWDDVTVDRPVSLRRMPEILTTMAIDGHLPSFTETAVHARTLDEDRIAVRGKRWKCIRSGSEMELYDLEAGEADEASNEELESLGGQLIARYDEDAAERERIVDAAGEGAEKS